MYKKREFRNEKYEDFKVIRIQYIKNTKQLLKLKNIIPMKTKHKQRIC